MKYCLVFLCLVCLSGSVFAQGTLRDTVFLARDTHINYDLAAWDSVICDIERGTELIEHIKLTMDDNGQYTGIYIPTYSGNFIKHYYYWYGDEVMGDPEGFYVLDTTAFHGAAAGITAASVVDEFEDRGYGYGSGTFACTVYTKLDTDSSAIPNIHVIARNTDQTDLLAHGYTNANGWVDLGLDSIAGGAYHKFWLMNINYSFTLPESADVNSSSSVTFYGSAFDYGEPPPDSQCAVYDQIFNPFLDSLNGVIISAKVYVPGDSLLTYKGFPISPFTVADTTDVTGRWRLDLIPNPMLKPDNTKYIFNIRYPVSWGGYFTIPSMDTLTVPKEASKKYGTLKGR